MRRSLWYFTLLLFLTALIGVGCTKEQLEVTPADRIDDNLIELSVELPEVQKVMIVQDRYTDDLMSISGVVGTATTATQDGQPAILVMVKEAEVALETPKFLDNIPVVTMVTGEINELKGPPGGGGGFDPTAKHRPAPNGVSIGHPDITAGTLGCLVSDGSTTYILSNNHVMANENQATNGDDIYQPGPYDGGTSSDVIAMLSDWVDIDFNGNNLVDAAIAAVNTANVTGETVSYGAPNSTTSTASINMKVIKYGRTTESTKGRVQAINATINVGYDSGVATFVDQIVIGGNFSAGGDSGSLIVVEKGQDANNPVGLLFAGSTNTTIANPINEVLNAFNVSVVGATGSSK